MSALPPGPSEPQLVQTLRWLLRPISFLESCRRRFGDAFSVSFLGFQTPMVMLSDPDAIRALYSVPGHTLPPGRTIALQPIMGSRSLLLLEGREHLARRKLMLPPFHGERMRAYETTVREVVEREVASWPEGEAFALHPRMQAVTLEVILRAVFGVTDPARRAQLADGLGRLLAGTSSSRVQFGVLLFRRLGGPIRSPAWPRCGGRSTACSSAEIAERRADPREDILSLLVTARFEDGEPMDDAGDPRPADDAAARRARDDGDRPGVDVRPAAAPPARRSSAWSRRSTPGRRPTCARWCRSRCGCARSSRSRAGG